MSLDLWIFRSAIRAHDFHNNKYFFDMDENNVLWIIYELYHWIDMNSVIEHFPRSNYYIYWKGLILNQECDYIFCFVFIFNICSRQTAEAEVQKQIVNLSFFWIQWKRDCIPSFVFFSIDNNEPRTECLELRANECSHRCVRSNLCY